MWVKASANMEVGVELRQQLMDFPMYVNIKPANAGLLFSAFVSLLCFQIEQQRVREGSYNKKKAKHVRLDTIPLEGCNRNNE